MTVERDTPLILWIYKYDTYLYIFILLFTFMTNNGDAGENLMSYKNQNGLFRDYCDTVKAAPDAKTLAVCIISAYSTKVYLLYSTSLFF